MKLLLDPNCWVVLGELFLKWLCVTVYLFVLTKYVMRKCNVGKPILKKLEKMNYISLNYTLSPQVSLEQ